MMNPYWVSLGIDLYKNQLTDRVEMDNIKKESKLNKKSSGQG